jgi:SPP1 gp7 family putative phage head morphogenesis protein
LVEKAALDHAGELAKGLSATTLDRVKSSIAVSMANGETVAEATARLSGTINDPARAEMIARTESVKSYNTGIQTFGESSGAKTKTWQAFDGACPICTDLDGEEADINDEFSSGDDSPPSHPNCRCTMYLTYPNGDVEDS